MDTPTLFALALQSIRGLGPAKIKRALSLPLADPLSPALLVEVAGRLGVRITADAAQNALDEAEATLNACSRSGISALALGTSGYPLLLEVLKDPPPILYLRGSLPDRAVAVIGTRTPSPVGSTVAARLGAYLSDNGWAVCNGLAEGVDAAAVDGHAAARGHVLGVLAGGLDVSSSKTASKAVTARAERTLDGGGAIVSEVGPGVRENTFSIVKSCRLQAGLSQGTILVESGAEGGSRFAVEALAPLGRPLGVVALPADRAAEGAFEMNAALLDPDGASSSWLEKLHARSAEGWPVVALQARTDYVPFLNRMSSDGGARHPSLFSV